MEKSAHAPVFEVEPRTIVAVEHPMIVKNLDNGIKTFGNNRPFLRVIETDDPEDCIPLYLRYNDPMCVPILSHHTPTNNVLLKITVPKRTGRKRKRGSQDPFIEVESQPLNEDRNNQDPSMDNLRSHSRLDDPSRILRSLKDNKESYTVEAIGEVKVTHRFRGASDFHHSTSNSTFFPKFRDTVLTGKVEELRKFKFDMRRGWKPNEEFMPPPTLTLNPMHFNWAFQQNLSLSEEVDKTTGERTLVNHSRPKSTNLVYIQNNVEHVPISCPFEIGDDQQLRNLVARMQAAMAERPIWTRRALLNHLGEHPDISVVKPAIQSVGYMFKGGPFRDAVIKYGIDPRTDKSFRKYQTLFFKLYEEGEKPIGRQWVDGRSSSIVKKAHTKPGKSSGHIFDGQTLTVDGKVWQVCDVTEPLLANLMENAPYAPYDPKDGYFHNGSIAKIKAIMKTKLLAIRTQKHLVDDDFKRALAVPDIIPDKNSRTISIPLPDVRLTNEEMEILRAKGEVKIVHNNGMRKRDSAREQRLKRIKLSKSEEATRPKRSYNRKPKNPDEVPLMKKPHHKKPKPSSLEDVSQSQEMAESSGSHRSQLDNSSVGISGNQNAREVSVNREDDDGLSILDDNTDDEDMETITDIEEEEISDY